MIIRPILYGGREVRMGTINSSEYGSNSILERGHVSAIIKEMINVFEAIVP